VHSDGRSLGENVFVRTGLLGFLGPVSKSISLDYTFGVCAIVPSVEW